MSTLSRVIYDPDTTPPSIPISITATTLSQTTIRIAWAASTDTGGSGLAGYRVYRATTSGGAYSQVGQDLSTSSLALDDTSLSAGTTRFYRIVSFDNAGNVSLPSTVVSATTQAVNPSGLSWPVHVPGYVSVLPGVGGYGMNTVAGSGRHLATPATTIILVNSLAAGNTGGAVSGLGANVFAGTLEYAWRHAASPKVVIPIISGWAVIQDSIPCQTGTPPRPGYVTYYGQAAPNPGLFLRGANMATNGASNFVAWHLRSYMGDDVAGLGAGNRDCFSSGYGAGTTQSVVLINCEFAWSVDELADFNRSHSQISLLNCAFIDPLHLSTVVHPEDGPGVDHGFAPIIGGDTGQVQTESVTTFRNLWANSTGRNPLVSSRTFSHVNNLHYNHGRPGGGAGNAVQIIAAGATQANYANVIGNGFIRGPNNNGTMVSISVTGTFPAGSAGYSNANAQFGWTSPANQSGFFTAAPTGFVAATLQSDAYPSSWGTGLTGVLQWSANPLQPTPSEWSAFVDLMESSVGAQPRWRTAGIGRVGTVFNQIRDRINGVTQTDQFVDTVTEAGGWFTVPSVTIDPLNPGTHWHAPLPTASDRDTPYTSGVFADGKSRVGYTRLEAWAYEQHLYVTQVDVVAPTVPTNVTVTSQSTTTLLVGWTASADTQSGVAAYRVYRSTTLAGTYTQVGSDVPAGTLSYSDSSLSAGQTRYYKVSAIDVAGNESAQSTAASATTQSSGGGVVVTSWANFNLATNPTNGIDFSAQDYPIWTPNNATYHTYVAGGAWDGTPSARIRGSQVAQTACGLGNWVNLWRNGTVAIRKLNLRMQLLFGPTLVQNWTGSDWKFIIVQTNPTLTSETDPGGGERPMLHFNWASEVNGSGTGPAKLGLSAASGTVGNFVRTPPFAPSYGSSPNSDWFMGASAATYNGHPVIGPMEWINLEMECISESTVDAPNGRIRYIVTRRNGQVFDLQIPWNFDSAWSVGDYIHNVQLIGGYWNQSVNASDAGTYYELANIVFAANRTGVLGPPTGFVTG